jgi:hypothetical protein
MTTSYTTNKAIGEPANGDTGWGTTLNTSLSQIDTAFGGSVSLNATSLSGNQTLTSAQYSPLTLNVTGTLTANVTYVVPSGVGGQWMVYNGASGSYTLAISSAAGGSSISIAAGSIVNVTCDGSSSGMKTAQVVLPSSSNTFTGIQTFSGTSSNIAAVFTNAAETVNIVSGAPASTQTFYLNNGSVQYYTSNATTNWNINIAMSSGTSLASALSVGQAVTVAIAVKQGTTPYYNLSVQVDGTTVGVTTYWQGGSAPSVGYASGVDIYTYTVIKTAATPTYTVFASQTQF